ncbi:MAG: hypothetical protein D6734_12855 [Candidatus Schekmanbacteria bacterium]|nr:MAG: hypothetical protein D6734_12855 [Candidatus Schekmanbacteria bacterium]
MKRREFLEKGKKIATVTAVASLLKKWVSPQIISLEDDAYADKKPKCPKKNESVEKRLKKCRKKKGKKFS